MARKKFKHGEKRNRAPSDLGPKEPIFKAKMYTCQECGCSTINRFKCSRCWYEWRRTHGGGLND